MGVLTDILLSPENERDADARQELRKPIEETARYASDVTPIREIEAGKGQNWLGRLWTRPWGFRLLMFLVWIVIPLSAFGTIGVVQGTLFLDGEGHGVLEATAFLTYFPASFLYVVATHYAFSNVRKTLNSLTKIARLEDDTSYIEDDKHAERFESRLTKNDLNQLFGFYEFVIAKYTFRKPPNTLGELHNRGGDSDGDEFDEDLKTTWKRWFLYPQAVLILCGFVFFVVAAEHHWNAVETYGFALWSSKQYVAGFAARTVFDFLLYVVMGPFVASRLLAAILLMHHSLTRMEQKNGIRFLRFAIDEAGGFGAFGRQSLKNTLILLPSVIPIAASIVFLPTNELTVLGVVGFILSLPIAFFWPLLGARRSMKRMKALELELISDSLLEQYEAYKEKLEQTDTEDADKYNVLTEHGEAVERSQTIFNGIKNQPAWPFSKTLIGQFASLMTALVGALGSLLGLFGDLFSILPF
jgi:hypothetical protein